MVRPIDREPDLSLQGLNGYGGVRSVLRHPTTVLQSDQHDAEVGLLDQCLGGMISKPVGVSGSDRSEVPVEIDLDHRLGETGSRAPVTRDRLVA